MRPWRILHLVSSPTLTGPAAPALSLAVAQARQGCKVTFAYDTVRPGDLHEHLERSGLDVLSKLRLCTRGGLKDALSDIQTLLGLGGAFDVVHCHSSHDHTLAALAGLGPVLVRSIHHPRSLRWRGLQDLIYARTRGLFLLGSEHEYQLLLSYPEMQDRCSVLPPAVDTERFRPQTPRPSVFGHVARIKAGRGHDTVFRAFALARQRRPDLRLQVVGKGEGLDTAVALCQELGIQESVEFLGFRQDDLPQVTGSFAWSVLPEGGNDAGCRAAFESMACAVPVLLGSHLKIPRGPVNEGGGLLVGERVEHWARALLFAASVGPGEYLQRRRAARGVALRDHSLAEQAQTSLRHYSKLGLKAASRRRLKERVRHEFLKSLAGLVEPESRLASASPKRVLVVRVDDRVGNVVLTGPLLNALKRQLPEARVDALVAARLTELVPPGINAIPYAKRDLFVRPWRYFSQLLTLRSNNYDVVIDASHWHRFSGTSAALAACLGAPMKIAHDRGEAALFADATVEAPSESEPEVITKARLLKPLGLQPSFEFDAVIGRDSESEAWARQHTEALGRFVVLYPGARKPGHRAPLEFFVAAARAARECGVQSLVLWGPGERELGEELEQRVAVNIGPASSLAQLAAVFRRAEVVVSNDTGPMHLSVAVGAPTLSFFTSSDPARWAHPVAHHYAIDTRRQARAHVEADCRRHLRDWLG